ncbi:MAG TPA: hypothetical protein VMN60_05015 [Longimicrobiales bacterium]|nr:hypothetical protein [Longimicrobiales bacterium]
MHTICTASALNPHFHFHVVVLDGVFSESDDGSVTVHEATHLSADDVQRLERTLQRALRLFQRRGLLDEHTVEDMLLALGRHDGEAPVDAATHPGGDGTPHEDSETESPASHPPDAPQRTAARSRWARLLACIYEVFPLTCPDCAAEMRMLAFITAAEPVETEPEPVQDFDFD